MMEQIRIEDFEQGGLMWCDDLPLADNFSAVALAENNSKTHIEIDENKSSASP